VFTVLRLPGAIRAFFPALLGRSALAMAGLALLLVVQYSTGSFADAGFASATFGIANVLAAPWRARAVDRWGQRVALTTMGVAQSAAFVGLAVLASTPGASLLWFIVLSIGVGVTAPPLGAAMRVLWASLTTLGDQP
jgi:MFS family permease